MIKYFTRDDFLCVDTRIKKVTVDRETKTGVWVHGRREPKDGWHGIYHDTWVQARDHLLWLASLKIDYFKKTVRKNEKALTKLKDMIPPGGLNAYKKIRERDQSQGL